MGAHCRGRYPWAIKGCRDYLSGNVIGAIHIRMNRASSFDPIPASITPPAEHVPCLIVGTVDGHGIVVEETRFTGIALFSAHHTDTDHLCFVGQQVNEASIRNMSKLLSVLLAHLHFLFPKDILTNDERADTLCD